MYKQKDIVIAELKKMFCIENNKDKGTFEHDGYFAISKQQLTRSEVIGKLRRYFDGVGIKDGYVSVEPLTLVFTVFKVCDGTP